MSFYEDEVAAVKGVCEWHFTTFFACLSASASKHTLYKHRRHDFVDYHIIIIYLTAILNFTIFPAVIK